MTAYPHRHAGRALPVVIVVLLVIFIALAAAGWYLRPRFESQAPLIRLAPETDVVGMAPLEIVITDEGTGLRSVTATLSTGGAEQALANEQYAQPVFEKKIPVVLSKIPGLKEGPATIRVTARDGSLWNMFKGNEATMQKTITIDITPPTIELVADDRYVNFGGVGAITYKSSADTVKSGVQVGSHFYPGVPGLIKDQPDRLFCLFSHSYDMEPSTRAVLVATDKAGNTRRLPLVYELKNVKYKKSTITLSESFLQGKIASLAPDVASKQATPKELFLAVNERLRKENEDRITEITSKVTPALQWKDAFAQLSNSKVEANFADLRTYTYNGEPISTRYHLGYDLSVTKHYPIEAANSGTVAFTGDLGIYGNAVIIDHGLGLYTLYGHMSSIDVKAGDTVKKLQPLGKTGETGLAAGDHLHFGVYLDGIAILPVEWWDQKWIDDNITPKLEGRGGQEIAESQQAARGPRKPARRHR